MSRKPVELGQQLVELAYLPCSYGGERPYFLCPRCRRRCMYLYRAPRQWHFACRICLDLAYDVECEPEVAALKRRQRKLAARLGPNRSKPLAMRWRTFWPIYDRLAAYDREFEALLAIGYAPSRGAAMSTDLTGLLLIAPTGVAWRWVGHTWVASRRYGVDVRMERWEAPCRACGAPFTVLAKLAGGHRQRFLERRSRAREVGQAVDVRLTAPADRPIKAFQLRNCKAHRGCPDPAGLV